MSDETIVGLNNLLNEIYPLPYFYVLDAFD